MAENSVFDLIQVISSTALFRNCVLLNHTVLRRLITASNSVLVLDNVLISNVSISANNFLLQSSKKSSITFRHSTLTAIISDNFELSDITDTAIVLEGCIVSGYRGTLIRAVQSSVTVVDCAISAGRVWLDNRKMKRWITSGFLQCEECSSIVIRRSVFTDIEGNSGGVISATRFLGSATHIEVTAASFEQCRAENDGGVIHAVGVDLYISDSDFLSNTARRGGVLFFDSAGDEQGLLANCSLISSVAVEGGAVYWTHERPAYRTLELLNNSAKYGDFEATLPHHLSLFDSEVNIVSGVSGTMGTTPVVIAICDILNQTVATENSINLQLVAEDSGTSIQGGTAVSAQDGIVSFSSIIVYAAPGSMVHARVYTSHINLLPDLQVLYAVRLCRPGEIATPTGCEPCPKNTFSLNTQDTTCHFCHEGATCLGGANITLDRGFWRTNNLSSEVFRCIHPSACNGGPESNCSAQYEGRLCSQCSPDHFHVGTGFCTQCRNSAAHWGSAAVFGVILLAFVAGFVYLSTTAFDSVKKDTHLAILKICINYFHLLLAFSLVYIDWSYSAAVLFYTFEAFTSHLVTLWTSPCFFGTFYSDFGMSAVYVRAIAASAVPIVLVVAGMGTCWLLYRVTRSWYVYNAFGQVQLVLLYLSTPFAIKSGMELVSCVKMEEGSLWLQADLTVQCWDTFHIKMVCLVLTPVIILYCIGYPVMLIFWYVRERIKQRVSRIRFLVAGYESEMAFWEICYISLKSVLLVVVSLAGGINVKVQFIFLTMLLYLFLSQLFYQKPFNTLALSVFAKISIGLLLLLCVVGYFRSPLASQSHEAVLSFLEALIVTTHAGLVVFCGVLLVKNCLRKLPDLTTVYPITSSINCNSSVSLPNPNPTPNASFSVG